MKRMICGLVGLGALLGVVGVGYGESLRRIDTRPVIMPIDRGDSQYIPATIQSVKFVEYKYGVPEDESSENEENKGMLTFLVRVPINTQCYEMPRFLDEPEHTISGDKYTLLMRVKNVGWCGTGPRQKQRYAQVPKTIPLSPRSHFYINDKHFAFHMGFAGGTIVPADEKLFVKEGFGAASEQEGDPVEIDFGSDEPLTNVAFMNGEVSFDFIVNLSTPCHAYVGLVKVGSAEDRTPILQARQKAGEGFCAQVIKPTKVRDSVNIGRGTQLILMNEGENFPHRFTLRNEGGRLVLRQTD